MLEAADLTCVRGSRRLFHALSFRLASGTLLWVLGPNGSGKTSLLRLLCGLVPSETGHVSWDGQNVRRARESFHAALLFLGHAAAIKDDLSARENLRFGLAQSGIRAGAEQLDGALAELGVLEVEHVPARSLSQGQKRRVALARLPLAADKPLWILDEPFTALDAHGVRVVRSCLTRQLERGGSVVLTSHQEVELEGLSVQRLSLAA